MTDDDRIDDLVRNAWPTSEVSDDLRASTMERIHRAASEGRSEEAASSVPEAAPARGTRIMRFPRWAWAGIAAALLVVAIGIGWNSAFHTETAYATVSSQESLTLSVNRFDIVLAATPVDAASQDEVDDLGLVGLSYEEAMARLADSGWLGTGQVDVTVGANGSDQEDSLVSSTTSCLESAGCSGSCNGNRYGKTGESEGSEDNGTSQQGEGEGKGEGERHGSGNGAGNGSGNGACDD